MQSVNIDAAASILGVHMSTIRRLLKSGSLQAEKTPILWAWRIPIASLTEYTARREAKLGKRKAKAAKQENTTAVAA